MKLFCDEDFGKGVPEALRQVSRSRGIYVDYTGRTHSARRRAQRLGATDQQWITHVGRGEFLGLSCNTKILENPEEIDTIFREKAGIVFITTGQEDAVDLLLLLLKELDWLLEIHENTPRPFAYTINMSRRKKQVIGEVDFAEWKQKEQKETS